MFTRCTECQTLHTVTTKQLRAGQGMLRCKKKKCRALFNALEFISDSKDVETPTSNPLAWNQERPTGNSYYRLGSALGVLLLVAQFTYFQGPALLHDQSFRPWLEKLCAQLSCQLPVYNNLQELTVLQGSLTAQTDHSIAFSIIISNQSAFAQAYPNLKLTLMDYSGLPFSQRIFQPHEYLPATATSPFFASAR